MTSTQSDSERLVDGDSLNVWRCPACGSVIEHREDAGSAYYCNGLDMGPGRDLTRLSGGHRQRRMQSLVVEVMSHD